MIVESLLGGAQIAVAGIFAASVIEKGQRLVARTAAWHPVVLASASLRRRATPLMALSAGSDALAVLLILGWPVIGTPLVIVLLATYTVAALPTLRYGDRIDGCQCFWGRILPARTRSGLVTRNVGIGVVSLMASQAPERLDKWAVAGGAVLLALLSLLVRSVERSKRGGLRLYPRPRKPWIRHPAQSRKEDIDERGSAMGAHTLDAGRAAGDPPTDRNVVTNNGPGSN